MYIGQDMTNTPNKNVELNTITPGNLSVPQSCYPSHARSAPKSAMEHIFVID